MTIVLCMVIGALLGWIGYAYAGFNAGRNTLSSMTIGAVGGFVGQKFLAPMFFAPAASGDPFNLPAIAFAVVGAFAFLALGNWVDKRWGF